jgi:photosystem II stability/assembly factor-like uncharacterized protein
LNPLTEIKRYFILLSFFGALFSSCIKEQIELLTQEISTGNSYQLHDVFFLNDSVGFVCGGSRYTIGIFLKTTDGGKTWTTDDSIMPKCAYTNFFFSEAEGIVGGYDSWFAYTNDSAKTFSANTGNYSPINDMTFLDRQHGLMVSGDGYASGHIAYTSNGGSSWSTTDYLNNFRTVQYADSNTAYASGYGVIYKSTDAGQTFLPLDVRGDFFVAMDFPTPNTGYFAGYQGSILKTSNGGSSFKKVMNGNVVFEKREHFEAINFWNENIGYVAGDGGIMYKTTNGGESWQKVKSFTSENLRDIHLFSATEGIVVGDNGKIFLFKN